MLGFGSIGLLDIVLLQAIGCFIYIGMVIIPEFVQSRRARQFGARMREIADPHRGLREAHREVGLVGSVVAKRALAEQHFARGQYVEAVAIYKDALQGQFREDTALLYGLARAQFMTGDAPGAQA